MTGLFLSNVLIWEKLLRSNSIISFLIKDLRENHTKYVSEGNIDSVLFYIKNIENVYAAVPHFANSFEMGVALIDEASVYLNYAIHYNLDSIQKNNNIKQAYPLLKDAIRIYDNWKERFSNLSKQEIEEIVRSDYDFKNEYFFRLLITSSASFPPSGST